MNTHAGRGDRRQRGAERKASAAASAATARRARDGAAGSAASMRERSAAGAAKREVRAGHRLAHLAELRKLRRAARAAGDMRLDLAGVPGIELAVEQRVQQHPGFIARHHRSFSSAASQAARNIARAARQPRHHRADRRADDLGDLAIGQVVDLAQHDRLAEWRRQRAHHVADRLLVAAAQHMRLRRLRRLAPQRHRILGDRPGRSESRVAHSSRGRHCAGWRTATA